MKPLRISLTVTVLLWISISFTQGAATMRITDGVTTTTVVDGGPGDSSITTGTILFSGSVGGWSVFLANGNSKPVTGSDTSPSLALSFQVTRTSGGQGTLSILFSDDNFNLTGASNVITAAAGSLGDSGTPSLSVQSYFDPGNVVLAQTTLLTSRQFNAIGMFSGGDTGGPIGPDSSAAFTLRLDLSLPVSAMANGAAQMTLIENTDDDGDGIPSFWEDGFGMDRNNPNDAQLDPDGDGANNLDEYRADTIPTNTASVFRMTAISTSAQGANLQFLSRTGLIFQVEYENTPGAANWITLTQFVATATLSSVIDAAANFVPSRYYRVSAARANAPPAFAINQLGLQKFNIPTGSNSITRPLLGTINNQLSALLPSVPEFTCVYIFNNALQSYQPSCFDSINGWQPEQTLLPGETFGIAAVSPFTLTFVGEVLAAPTNTPGTIVWTNVAGGNWSVAANWNPNQVPTSTNHVFITNAGTYTVVLDVNATNSSFSLGGGSGTQTFVNSNRNFTASPASIASNGVAHFDGSGSWNGILNVTGTFVWSGGGTIQGQTTIFPGGSLNLDTSGGSIFLSGGRLVNFGTVHFIAGDLTAFSATIITNAGLWIFESNDGNGAIFTGLSGSVFHNTGTLRKTSTTVDYLEFEFFNSGVVEVLAGTINNIGTFNQATGTLRVESIFDSDSTLTLGGRLTGNGTIAANITGTARVSPGSPLGALTIVGNYSQSAAGVLEIQLGGTGPNSFDQLIVTGIATLGGTLEVRPTNGYVPSAGEAFIALTNGSRAGTFATVSTIPATHPAQATYVAGGVLLSFPSAPGNPAMIISQPSDQTASPGQAVILGVIVTGTPPFTYQWRHNGVNLPGETNETLFIPAAQPTNSGLYSVIVQNEFGPVVTSEPAELFVQAPSLALADNFAARTITNSFSDTRRGSNTFATLEPGEPQHTGKVGGHSVWFGWTAPADGVATFHTRGSSFDTLLAVYTGASVATLVNLTSDDDSGGFFTSEVKFNAQAGVSYAIAIDGLSGATGAIVLSWSLQTNTDLVPIILVQPVSRIVSLASAAAFQVVATNAARFQLFLNDTLIIDSTNAELKIPSVSFASLGTYTVRVLNGNQFVASTPVVLEIGPGTVTPTVEKFEDLFASNSFPVSGSASALPRSKPKPRIVSVTAGSIVTANGGARTQQQEPNHGGVIGGASRWQLFRYDKEGALTIDTTNSALPTALAAYTGNSLAALDLVAQDASDVTRPFARIQFRARAGVDYPVAIDTPAGQSGLLALNWNFVPAPKLTTAFDRIPFVPGSNVLLSVDVEGSNNEISYQWLRGTNGTDAIDGATNTLLLLTNVQNTSAGIYRLAVLYQGLAIAERDIECFVENTAPTIVLEPRDVNSVLGGAATFTVQVSGTEPFFYQWQKQKAAKKGAPPGFSIFESQPGATNSSYTISPLVKTSPGNFRVVVTNGNGSFTSRTVRLQLFKPVVISGQPKSAVKAAGQKVTLKVKAKGDALRYQWYFTNAPIAGANSASFIISNMAATNVGQYYVAVSNPVSSATSLPASIALQPPKGTSSSLAKEDAFAPGAKMGIERIADEVTLTITAPNGRYEVLVSSDLIEWRVAANITVAGHARFVERTSTPVLFYRLRKVD